MAAATTNAAAVLLQLFLCVAVVQFSTCNGDPHMGCRAVERLALLKFKKSLEDPIGRLSNWVGGDCCIWEGVGCNNRTGHVTMLNLGATDYNESFGGEINPSLLELKYLNYLDLSWNDFSGTSIPKFIGSLSRLRYLDISGTRFDGIMPHQLGNLTGLRYLDLRRATDFYGGINWLSRLSSLQYLDMSENNLKGADVFHAVRKLSKLSVLRLSSCSLDRIPASLPNSNLVSLATLDLSDNQFTTIVPLWLFNITSLVSIYLQYSGDLLPLFSTASAKQNTRLSWILLSRNFVTGSIPTSICDMPNLPMLDLSYNLLSGEIPHCSGGYPNLFYINLESNNLSGIIPHSIGSANGLHSLQLNNNSLHGEIPNLENCTELSFLDLGKNRLTGNIPTWIGKSLRFLRLRSNMLEGSIPRQLSHLKYLQVLDLANNNLTGTIPRWLGNWSAMASTNQTIGDKFWYWPMVKDASLLVASKGMELEYRKTKSLVVSLDLSGNYLSGDIPEELTTLIGLHILNFSNNHLTGTIPNKIGSMRQLESLDFSDNHLSGSIPSSISSLTYLSYLNLSNNNLTGRIPSGSQLQVLNDSSIYVGNRDLCGTPLPNKCQGDGQIPQLPTPPTGTREDGKHDDLWYYLGAMVGFVVGFWSICGPLLLKKSWRISYYKFLKLIDHEGNE